MRSWEEDGLDRKSGVVFLCRRFTELLDTETLIGVGVPEGGISPGSVTGRIGETGVSSKDGSGVGLAGSADLDGLTEGSQIPPRKTSFSVLKKARSSRYGKTRVSLIWILLDSISQLKN